MLSNQNAESQSTYRIFGAEMSPYSVKVRSYFRYKKIPHEWIIRNNNNDDEFQKYARLPIIPLIVTPDLQGIQDSTPIIESLENRFRTPELFPKDKCLNFIAHLLEEFGDEWCNKLMFHHRWWATPDQISAATILAWRQVDDDALRIDEMTTAIRDRMTSRGHFVGSNSQTAPLIRKYFIELIKILETHLNHRKYILGARPSFGDFGIAPQLYEASLDPTCAGIMQTRSPNTLAWCYRMLEPTNTGSFEEWDSLKITLEPLIHYIGRYFLPWADANAKAINTNKGSFSVQLAGDIYTQSPQKYHAKSLLQIRRKYTKVENEKLLTEVLNRAKCRVFLTPG